MAEQGNGPFLLPEAPSTESQGPVECLGMTFESDEARRSHFLERLKEKLPELRQRHDFPQGEDEDILRLSDPPYYTACLNPFLTEFVKQHGRRYEPEEPYHREPFAVDVSVGKTDMLYRAHGYHTVDKIMHGMELGAAGIHNQVRLWAGQPHLAALLDLLLESGFRVYLTSDHGNIEAAGCVRCRTLPTPCLRRSATTPRRPCACAPRGWCESGHVAGCE